MTVSTALRKVRERLGLTQSEVARRARLAPSYVSRLETGRIQPTAAMLERLADALAVPVSAMFDAAEAPRPGHVCPVSSSGQCVGRLIRDAEAAPNAAAQPYGEEELRLVRMADYVALHGSPELRAALGTLLEALLRQIAHEMPPRASRQRKRRSRDSR